MLFAGALCAQPAYEVASIKPNTSGSASSSTHGNKGEIFMKNQTLRRLVERAYDVKPFQVSAPGWLESLRFDISAKYPDETKPDDRMLMMRKLLEDRFKLEAHRETKDLPGYALVVAKKGLKIKPVENTGGGPNTNGTGDRVRTLKVEMLSMAQLADQVSRSLGEMVIDQTGVTGVFSFELRWTNDDQNPTATDADGVPSLFSALQETLGLRLQAQKVPVEMIVVDRVERVPIEN